MATSGLATWPRFISAPCDYVTGGPLISKAGFHISPNPMLTLCGSQVWPLSQPKTSMGQTGLRERGNDTSKSTGRSGRQKAETRRNMRREERVTVQGPEKEQQPDGMTHGG